MYAFACALNNKGDLALGVDGITGGLNDLLEIVEVQKALPGASLSCSFSVLGAGYVVEDTTL